MNLQADVAERYAIYKRLNARNRLVGILRIGVPLLGAITLIALIGQIYISSLTSRFGVGQISVTPEAVTIDAPQYSGLLDDGTAYRVSASMARAATAATDRIALSEAALTTTRPDGVVTTVDAAEALLDTTRQTVEIAGAAHVQSSEGTSGMLENSLFDYASQTLNGQGPVEIDYADGTHLVSQGMTYDAQNLIWTFTRATVTLPYTPGSAEAIQGTP